MSHYNEYFERKVAEETIMAPGSAEAWRRWHRRRALLRCFRRLVCAANYAILAVAVGGTLWIAADVYVAFHSGRVHRILSQPAPQMRVAGARDGIAATAGDDSSLAIAVNGPDGASIGHCATFDEGGPHGCVLDGGHTLDELMAVWLTSARQRGDEYSDTIAALQKQYEHQNNCDAIEPGLRPRPGLSNSSWKGGE